MDQPLIFTFFLLLFQQGFLETERDGRFAILCRFSVADHEIPTAEEFPAEDAAVLFIRQFRRAGILRHSELANNNRPMLICFRREQNNTI